MSLIPVFGPFPKCVWVFRMGPRQKPHRRQVFIWRNLSRNLTLQYRQVCVKCVFNNENADGTPLYSIQKTLVVTLNLHVARSKFPIPRLGKLLIRVLWLCVGPCHKYKAGKTPGDGFQGCWPFELELSEGRKFNHIKSERGPRVYDLF